MKKFAFFIGFCILFLGFVTLSTQAQEAAPPQNFIVFEEFVSPADRPAFKTAQDSAMELWKKHNWDIPVYSYLNDDNAYYWVIPLENFASIDALFEKSVAMKKKIMEEEGYNVDKEFRDLSTSRQSVIHWSQKLSYHPSGEYGQSPDKGYVEWAFAYLKAGHEKEARAVIKKYIEFYDGIEESLEWDVYVVMLGHDTPCWILMSRAESELAMREKEHALQEKYGKEFKQLWNEFLPHVRKIENKKGWFLPRWSMNLPE